MRIHSLFFLSVAAIAMTAGLAGCYTYPVYAPAPIARLSPQQSAALANGQPLSQADRDRLAKDNAQIAQQDQASQAYSYAYPVAPVYATPYYASPYYYGYPYYYGGYSPFYPGLSLSVGFGGHYGHGWGGGFHGHR
jgi:hypothetical protein